MPSVTHEVDQMLEVDLTKLGDDDRSAVLECHNKPDVYISDDSFPGEMKCRIVDCLVAESAATPRCYTLRRKLFFDFTWEDEGAMSEWEEDNTNTDNSLLPSYVAGDYEGLFVGENMCDYETDYLGVTT
jgi:hypothetical protein